MRYVRLHRSRRMESYFNAHRSILFSSIP
ncbi:hypothetical protein PUN4_320087 [Paraburkholderia unamae]|nr:hypothetical protein PUN4_320087 [Paraburkholderia unamae]